MTAKAKRETLIRSGFRPQHFDVRGAHPDGNWHRMWREWVWAILTSIAADPAECMAALDAGEHIYVEDSGYEFSPEGKGRRTWRGEA